MRADFTFPLFSNARIVDSDIEVTIQAVLIRPNGFISYECAWLHNGVNYEVWLNERRLEAIRR